MRLYLPKEFDLNKLFFTADLHLNHANIIRLTKRPFSGLDDMHYTIMRNWNAKVPADGIVFNLGDLSWDKALWTREYLDKLNGKQYFVIGNHDKIACAGNVRSYFQKVKDYDGNYVSICDNIRLTVNDDNVEQDIILDHYATASWDKMYHGSWMLHGHSHGSFKMNLGKLLDVGVDCHNFTPVSYFELKEIMSKRPFIKTETHD